ncbi:unnamed protein product [Phyllotreta striolata]|uniref:Ionotropic glutamate receptor C-terminal domain-containing protein n=1 Tax=Phyllotreta striolata TaxID=444603 RepID=A0A9N9U071_PHYSR|nr:unnamed protein product [Phyllotreta striolata]
MYIRKVHFVLILCYLSQAAGNCSISENIAFICDYVHWREINHLIIIDEDIDSVCGIKTIKDNLKTLMNKNIYFATYPLLTSSEATLNITSCKTAVVTFLKDNFTVINLLEDANFIGRYGGKVSWLLLAHCHLQTNIMNELRYGNFGIDSDIAIDDLNSTQYEITTNKEDSILPFRYNFNKTATNSTITCVNLPSNETQETRYLYQIYNIRRNYNTSLVVRFLGDWNPVNSTKNLKLFWPIEDRDNFHQYPLVVGIHGTPSDGPMKEQEVDTTQIYYADYIFQFLNSSKSYVGFVKLGNRENNEWTDLLHALVDEVVDISGQGISKTTGKINDMAFSFDILKNSRHIYVTPQESEKLRNIFTTPFDSRLILCVVGTGFILSLGMTVNNWVRHKLGGRRREFSESIVWCVGIFTQQGSIWKTRSLTEKIIVLITLFLTVLTYNSYSAFITSILSVELYKIQSVTDLLESDYKIGYVKNGEDEDYLRSVNISELKQIYLRGYLQHDLINISEGLMKVTSDHFAFFASGQSARTHLLNVTKGRCKFEIQEIKIPYTNEYMAILMSKNSPYKKLINLSVIKMFETGVYKYINSAVYPAIKQCMKHASFQSARLADLSTAFFIVLIGWMASLVLMSLECVWKKRRIIRGNLKRRFQNGSDTAGAINAQLDFDTYVKFLVRNNAQPFEYRN